jgi:hypothetical protein
MSALPDSSQMLRNAATKLRGCSVGYLFWTGSIMIAASSRPRSRSTRSASSLPYSSTSTFSTALARMPGAAEIERRCLVPRTITSSKMPWYELVKMAIVLRPVTARAMRIAPITASEPVLQKATRAMPVRSAISCATSAARGCCGPTSRPALSCCSSAATTSAGW